MASLLASLDSLEKVAGKKSKKEGRKHSKREKETKKNSEDGVSRLVKLKSSSIGFQSKIIRGAYETCYETQSEDEDGGGSKKKKKGWKSKHKNVIDPVFLGELEHLIQDISCCQLELKLSPDLWPERPSDCVPSIFRRRKIHTPTKRRKDSSGKVTKRTKAQKQASQHQAEVAILDLTESDEQRLPLKKRHHHLQGDGKEGKETAEKRIVGTLQVKSPEKICREFRISSKVRLGEESTEGCLSPSKMISHNEMRSQASGGKNIHEKLLKRPTAADRIVEKLGIQIKKESLEINNESKLGRPGKVSDRTSRRISKELDFTKPEPSAPRNTNTQQSPFAPVVKHESKTKSFTETTFVDSIQDCIEKYTNASSVANEKQNLQLGVTSSKTNQNLSKKISEKREKAQGSGDSTEGSYVTLFSSPEHDVNITSGRNSSMSQSSTSSDSCSIINLDPEPEVTKSRMGRASSRQDLHSHLWKQDEPSQTQSSSSPSSSSASKAAAYRSLVSETMRKRGLEQTTRPQTSSTKPLPTEPIRRVDLVQGYCHKPLDKSGRPLSGQECLIRKVPQAIVAPFRRNPPEPPMAPVVPIHRASIAAHTTSTAAEALINATTSLTDSLPPIAPASVPLPPPTLPLPAPAPSPPKESPASPVSSLKKRAEEAKTKDKDKEKEETASTIAGSSSLDHPKTRSKLELEAKLENTKKEAKIKRCKVAVERLNENISRRALLGVSSLEERVADLQVTETERNKRRRGSVDFEPESEAERIMSKQVLAESDVEKRVADLQVSDTDRPRRRRGSIEAELCVTQQLEALEKSRQSLASGSSGPVKENCDQGGKMGSSSAEPITAAGKKENGGGSSESDHKLEKISDKPELTQSGPAVLGTEDRLEEEKMALEKQGEVRKRRRKTNKTGFPSTMKKRRRIEHESSRQQWVSCSVFRNPSNTQIGPILQPKNAPLADSL